MIEVEKKKTSTGKKAVIAIAVVIILIAGYFALNFYRLYFAPNVTENQKYLYIKTGESYDELLFEIKKRDILNSASSFA
ncbi:MAG: aminodeoxychorismate lyase, partial [Pedobacter sp.]